MARNALADVASMLAAPQRQEQRIAKKASRDQYGWIALDEGGNPTVLLDGGEEYAACTAMVGVHHGDRVMCHIVNHRIVVFANVTAPTTDDSTALVAIDRADTAAEAADKAGIAAASAQADATQAKADAAIAKSAAQGAVSDAATAKAAATQAQSDAASAEQSAQSAQRDASDAADSASAAQAQASTASQAATAAQGSAATAATAAQQAQSDAADAADSAQAARDDADAAQASATAAQGSASTAAASATAAQGSASSAATSATNAASSARAAASDAAQAREDADDAATSAANAATSASQASTSATSAATSATNAESSASSAEASASDAATSAGAAASSASTAQQQASAATTAANEAKADAKTAKDNAAQAVSDAATAKQAATDATATANGAVTALATVQGVVDQLETDVDELQVHVAMMDAYSDGHGGTVPAGLHVVPTGSGYFLVIANDGTYVYDAQSVLVTKFGESIDFSSTRPQRIGNDTAYVEYYDSDNDGIPDSIRIVGTNLNTEIANFKQTVSETYATKNALSTAETNIASNANAITLNASKLETVANPNLSPFWSMGDGDLSYWSDKNKGYYSSELGKIGTQLADGWAHFEMDNSARGGSAFVNFHCVVDQQLAKSMDHTFLVEVRNLSFASGSSLRVQPITSNESAARYDQFATKNPMYVDVTVDGSYRIAAVTVADYSPCKTMCDGFFYVAPGVSCSFDIRLSLYEGEYAGPYKPYVGTKLYASQAELKVQSDRIGMVVSNQDASSSLALTADAMEYIGDHVEIKGSDGTSTVISGGKLQTNKITVGSLKDGSSYATNTSVDNKIKSVEIGGRNLLLGTSDEWSDWVKPENKSNNTKYWYISRNDKLTTWAAMDAHVTCSFEIEFSGVTASTGGSFRIYAQDNFKSAANVPLGATSNTDWNNGAAIRAMDLTTPPADGVYRCTASLVFTNNHATRYALQFSTRADWWASGKYRIRKVKYELGNKPTDWTPAPEDVDAAVDDATKTATNYITADPTDGIKVHDSGDVTTFVQIASGVIDFVRSGVSAMKMWVDNSVAKVRVGLESAGHSVFSPSGMEVFTDANTSVASFGSAARIGKAYVDGATDNESHMELDYHSLQLVDRDGNIYFHVSDLRDSSGELEVTDTFMGDGSTWSFVLSTPPAKDTDYTVTVSDSSGGTVTKWDNMVVFGSAPSLGATITVVYVTTSDRAKAYTFGTRASDSNVGSFSVAEGYQTTASGSYAHSEGYQSVARGQYSHAESVGTASGDYSHAENGSVARGQFSHAEGHGDALGYCSHAEGDQTTATTHDAHAEGYRTEASGYHSHAQNYGTIAASDYQTALGKYNISNANNVYAVIVGNGTSDDARSNALTVCWDGTCHVGNVQSVAEDNHAYPLFIWTSNMANPESYSGTYPVSPCFVYYVPNNGLYYCEN